MVQAITDADNTTVLTTTLLQIKEDIGGMRADITHIRESIQETNHLLTSHVEKDEDTHKSQDNRITTIEDSQKRIKWLASGAAAVFTTLGWLGSIFFGYGHRH